MTETIVGWIDRVRELTEIIEESHAVLGEITGNACKEEENDNCPTPAGLSGRLTTDLSNVIRDAHRLLTNLQEVKGMF